MRNALHFLFTSQFVVITIIVTTFISFVVIPDLLMATVYKNNVDVGQDVLYVLYQLAVVFDALTYMLVNKNVRKKLMRKLSACLGRGKSMSSNNIK